MAEIVAEIVAEERPHGEGVVHHDLPLVLGGRRGLGLEAGAHENAVTPVQGFADQRYSLGSAAAEEDGLDFHACGAFPAVIQDGAVLGGGAESERGKELTQNL